MTTGTTNAGDIRPAILITGCSSGIGQEACFHFAQKGFIVFATVRTKADAKKLSSSSNTAGGTKKQGEGSSAQDNNKTIIPIIMDLADRKSVKAGIDNLTERLTSFTSPEVRLVAVVNNAAFIESLPLEFMPLDTFCKIHVVNVVGTLDVIQRTLPLLRESRAEIRLRSSFPTPRIVNVSSLLGHVALPFHGAYSASKFAVEAITDCLRRELSPWGIHVCSVVPGHTKTPMLEKAAESERLCFAKLLEGKDGHEKCPNLFKYYGNYFTEEAIRVRLREAMKNAVEVKAVMKVLDKAVCEKKPTEGRYFAFKQNWLLRLLLAIIPSSLIDYGVRRSIWGPQNLKSLREI